jgi:cell division protein FtsW
MEIFRRSGFDKPLFTITLILIAFGLIMVFSSSAILANEKYQNTFHFFINQIVGAVIGIILIVVIITSERPFYQSKTFIYGILLLSFSLLALCLVMPAIGNTNRWIHFFGLRFQPSELAKISLILYLAYYFEKKKDKLDKIQSLILPFIVLSMFIVLIIKEPDYGTALFMFFIGIAIFFVGGVKLKHFLYVGALPLALLGFFLFQASYRLNRIIAFLYPTSDPLGTGFQANQSKLAVGSGGLLGVSIGESTQKLFFLPCAHTDYIYAILGEELGFIGALGVLFLFIIFLWRGFAISQRAPNLYSRILAIGITLAILTQALLNISIVLGLGPATGLPLPLFSFGRSSLVCTLFCIGILLHISQRKASQKVR